MSPKAVPLAPPVFSNRPHPLNKNSAASRHRVPHLSVNMSLSLESLSHEKGQTDAYGKTGKKDATKQRRDHAQLSQQVQIVAVVPSFDELAMSDTQHRHIADRDLFACRRNAH